MQTRCPHCETTYRLPEERRNAVLRCRKCGGEFSADGTAPAPATAARAQSSPKSSRRGTARSSAGARRKAAAAARPKGSNQGALWLVLLLVVGGGGTVLALQMLGGGDEPAGGAEVAGAPAPASAAPAGADPNATVAALDHPAAARVRFFQQALTNYNQAALLRQLDLESWWYFENGAEATRWTALPTADRATFGTALAARLVEDSELRAFAAVESERASYLSRGLATVELELRSSNRPDRAWRAGARLRDEQWLLASLSHHDDVAVVDAVVDPDAPPPPPKGMIAIESAAGERGLAFAGEVAIVELWPGTDADTLARIQAAIDAALSDDGLASRRAERELDAFGPQAVPLLLNLLVAYPVTHAADRIELVGHLDALLRRITYRRDATAFPQPGFTALADADALLERRQAVIQSWFGWWGYWDTRWREWKEKAGIPEPEPERGRRR